jgi:hypothetical protein
MIGENPKKKGHSVSLGKVVGAVIVTLLIGMVLGGYLGLAVVGPALQKLHFGFGNQDGQTNTADQNNQNNNQNNNNNPNDNNNQNNNGNQGGGVINNIPSPSNPTGNYGGSGQFDIVIASDGNTISGTITANINCLVEQNGNSIQLSMTISPTIVSESLQQAISSGNSAVYNFAGTTAGSQITANSQGTMGGGSGGVSFDLNLRGTIDQSKLSFTITSASDSQITLTSQPTVLYPK